MRGNTAAYISPQVETILGFPLDELASTNRSSSRAISTPTTATASWTRSAPRGRAASRSRWSTASSRRTAGPCWLQDSFTIVRDESGPPWYSQGFALDVTDRKLAEQDRERLLRRAQIQNEQLRKLDRMKDEFIALVSHELRTPLTSIRGYLELLQDDLEAGTATPEQQRDFLQVIDRNSDRLQRLVEDLLLAAQVEVGTLQLARTTIDLGKLVADCVEASAPLAATREIELGCSVDGAPAVTGRPAAARPGRRQPPLERAEVHAGRAAPSTSGPRGTTARRSSRWPTPAWASRPRSSEALFGRFFRTERAQTEAIAGVGLGLSITKSIVEAHGGTDQLHQRRRHRDDVRRRAARDCAGTRRGRPRRRATPSSAGAGRPRPSAPTRACARTAPARGCRAGRRRAARAATGRPQPGASTSTAREPYRCSR